MSIVAVIDWSLASRSEIGMNVGKDNTFCPKVTGPRGGKKKIYDQMYHDGCLPPHHPVPATMEPHMSPELIDHWTIS